MLGRGGMGAVYRATDARGRVVALKVMLPEHARDERWLARFEREVEAARAVAHPNVTALVAHGEERGRRFVAFELVTGGSLEERLAARGQLPWREAVAVAAGVARGLAALHAAGVVHRDLKPANVLLDAEERPKLTDFGLARTKAGAGGLTRTGELLGTFEYAAPEQLDDARRVDARADLYALGALLHALLTGRPPFEGRGYELVKKHFTEAPRAPGASVPGIPPELDRIVLALLAKDPAARPADAGAVARALEAVAPPRRSLWPLAMVAALTTLVVLAISLRPGSSVPLPPAPPPPPGAPQLTTKRGPALSVSWCDSSLHPYIVRAVRGSGDSAISICQRGNVLRWRLTPEGPRLERHVTRIELASDVHVNAAGVAPDLRSVVYSLTGTGTPTWLDLEKDALSKTSIVEGVNAVGFQETGSLLLGGRSVLSWSGPEEDAGSAPGGSDFECPSVAIAAVGTTLAFTIDQRESRERFRSAWDLVANRRICREPLGTAEAPHVTLAVSRDLVVHGDLQARALCAATFTRNHIVARAEKPFGTGGTIHALAFSPDGQYLVVGRASTEGGEYELWRAPHLESPIARHLDRSIVHEKFDFALTISFLDDRRALVGTQEGRVGLLVID